MGTKRLVASLAYLKSVFDALQGILGGYQWPCRVVDCHHICPLSIDCLHVHLIYQLLVLCSMLLL